MKSFAARREMFKAHAFQLVFFWMFLHRENQTKEAALVEPDVHSFLKRNFPGVVFHAHERAVWVDKSTPAGKVEFREAYTELGA